MDFATLEPLIRAQFEPLQYVAFFGALFFLGVLEMIFALGRSGVERRRRWPVNFGLTLLNIAILSALPVGAIVAADFALARGWGLLNQAFVPPVLALAAGFLLRSLVSYVIHVAMHKVPVLWRVHRVHHSDTQMDISTTVRFHPLEFIIALPILLPSAMLLGIPPLALLLYELIDAAMAAFTHANIRLPAWLDRDLRLLLVTPAMHRIHHSAFRPETDSNYGATLSVWDRLFGTHRSKAPEALADMRLGLEEWRDRRVTSLAWLLCLPFMRERRRRTPMAEGRATGGVA